ncbi:MAG: aminoacyl-tRNA hydrolase [Proteobacteria bacterium]|nr:aminoacyl-tRNA hydrolase [Pseudomonadota bacterium]
MARWLKFLKLPAGNLVVIHDDLDLPFGKIRIKNRGGAGGHRGVESVIAGLGTPEFIRVRVGIGRPAAEMEEADYVLSEFSREEKREVPRVVESARDAVLTILESGIDKAQLKYHSL